MKEDFIAWLWKYRLLYGHRLQTTTGEPVEIIDPGLENNNSGPDFLAARVRIGETLWAGNVELHVCSSMWYGHQHHLDPAYDNIILHVVHNHDREVCKQNNESIPHLEIKGRYDPKLQHNYQLLLNSRSWIPCERLINRVDNFILQHWLTRLLVGRLARKADELKQYLYYFDNHWEKTFLFAVARSLGGKANAGTFGMLIQRTPWHVLAKNHDQLPLVEALLFGQAGLLSGTFQDPYVCRLQTNHHYLQKKYALPAPLAPSLWKYSRMRPANFPDIRIAQLAGIINKTEARPFMAASVDLSAEDIYHLFAVSTSEYWSEHYRFGKPSATCHKQLGQTTIYRIFINTLAPALCIYGKEKQLSGWIGRAVSLLEQLPPEENGIIREWRRIVPAPTNAAETQGLLELRKQYCVPKKCLQCSLGHVILSRPTKQPEA